MICALMIGRAGSGGFPKKNITKIFGKRLCEYSLTAAKKSKYIDEIVVSTDNKTSAKIARSKGVQVPFIRPKSLSKSNALEEITRRVHAGISGVSDKGMVSFITRMLVNNLSQIDYDRQSNDQQGRPP